MFCSNCGAQLPDGSKFCTACGATLVQEAAPQQPQQGGYQQPQQGGYPQQPGGYQPQQPGGYPQQGPYQPPYNPYGDRFQGYQMGWHKFLVYFALWAGALLNLIQGIMVMSGSHYGSASDAKLVYAVFSSLKAADVLYGIILIVTAIIGVLTAINLLGLKRIGPTFLTILYIVAAAGSILYIIMVVSAIGDYADTSELIARAVVNLITSVVMIIINNIYYKKRARLFVN